MSYKQRHTNSKGLDHLHPPSSNYQPLHVVELNPETMSAENALLWLQESKPESEHALSDAKNLEHYLHKLDILLRQGYLPGIQDLLLNIPTGPSKTMTSQEFYQEVFELLATFRPLGQKRAQQFICGQMLLSLKQQMDLIDNKNQDAGSKHRIKAALLSHQYPRLCQDFLESLLLDPFRGETVDQRIDVCAFVSLSGYGSVIDHIRKTIGCLQMRFFDVVNL